MLLCHAQGTFKTPLLSWKNAVSFPTKDVFIPLHCVFQRCHGKISFRQVLFLNPYAELDFFPRLGGECVLETSQIACHKGEEVAWFWKWVLPDGIVPAQLSQVVCSFGMCNFLVKIHFNRCKHLAAKTLFAVY